MREPAPAAARLAVQFDGVSRQSFGGGASIRASAWTAWKCVDGEGGAGVLSSLIPNQAGDTGEVSFPCWEMNTKASPHLFANSAEELGRNAGGPGVIVGLHGGQFVVKRNPAGCCRSLSTYPHGVL
jgi:hypothetical protein